MTSRLVCTLAVLASCTCSQPETAPPPPEHEPVLPPWSGPSNSDGPGLLSGGPVHVSARLSVLPTAFIPAELSTIDTDAPITATLARPSPHGFHHRLAWTQRPGTTWRDTLPQGRDCDVFDDATCIEYPDATAAVITRGQQVRVDLFTESQHTREELNALVHETPEGTLDLEGEVVARVEGLAAALGHPHPFAVEAATFEVTRAYDTTRLRVRWKLPFAPHAVRTDAPAPSWKALCDGAVACFRAGPVPNVGTWISGLSTAQLPDSAPLATLSVWGGAWPHVIAGGIERARVQLPDVAHGFFDDALAGIAEIAFAGGRVEPDGSFLAFARIPAPRVNFIASILSWAGIPAVPTAIPGSTGVSWAALGSAGIVLALDDGDDPQMGWIAYASTPERFAWIDTAPRTAAGSSSLSIHLDRLETALALGGEVHWLAPLADHALTARIEPQDGWLTAIAELHPKVR